MIKFLAHIDATLSRILKIPEYATYGALPMPNAGNKSSIAHITGSGVYYQSGTEWILLQSVINNAFKGLATPTTTPPDETGFWIGSEPGTYTNFLDEDGLPLEMNTYFAIFSHDGSGWVADEMNLVTRINDTPISYVPASTGNTDNLNEIVTAQDGTMWFIDLAGRGHRFTITSGDIEITDSGKGLIYQAPNGSRIRSKVTNYGATITNIL